MAVEVGTVTYWVHAYCAEDQVPTLGMVLDWTATRGVDLTEEPGSPPWAPEELLDRPWESLGLWYRPDWSPLLVSINHVAYRPAHSRYDLFASEVGWMREALAEFPPSRHRDLVLAHLTRSRFVVAVQLSVSALQDDDQWEAVWALLEYFVEHSDAIVHLEDTGFYQGHRLVLETPHL
jgi:hypothetical protein